MARNGLISAKISGSLTTYLDKVKINLDRDFSDQKLIAIIGLV
jgi:hypothetical protein